MNCPSARRTAVPRAAADAIAGQSSGQEDKGNVMNDRMILPRVSRDETTFAVVEYAGVDRLDLKSSIQRAITAWVKNSDVGRRAFQETDGDFNVGDLANELGDPALTAELAKERITHLTVETYCDVMPTGWEFDDHLVVDDEPSRATYDPNSSRS
jgi:hypothetical protein